MASTAPFPVSQTLGAYLLGTFLGTILYGFALHQAYRYARLFPKDYPLIRILVAAVLYYYLVSNYFNTGDVLARSVWSLNTVPILVLSGCKSSALLEGANMLLSQLFFARRVFLMGRIYRIVAAVALAFIALEIGLSLVALYKAFRLSNFNSFGEVNIWVAASFGAGVAGDTLLTVSLIRELYVMRKLTFDSALNIVSLFLACKLPNTLWDGTVNNVATKVYAITLLTVLNSRKLSFSQDVKVYGDESEQFGMNIIARANRYAVRERWNVPQATDPPARINIDVRTEMEDETRSAGKGLVSNGHVSDGSIHKHPNLDDML
ncbi:hypothetical protein C8Q74DRAFT_1216585 [Fomes fomentarius]|nr:hypothetical protein C8Q74DRAFT_1216585 [Fomes fomentarius]